MKLTWKDMLLYVDDVLLAVNKPAGLPTLPDGYDPAAPHVSSVLPSQFGKVWIVHRLDRETSGVLVLARTPAAHQSLNEQFETRQIAKVYHAIVRGSPKWTEYTVHLPLRPDGDRQHRTVVDYEQGKPCTTSLQVLQRLGRYSLIEARPEAGRTHQIRVHLAHQGYPIIADPLYGDGQGIFLSQLKPGYKKKDTPEAPLLARLGLHAWSLTLTHPFTNQPLYFEAPYPKDFRMALEQLRKYTTIFRQPL